jgi:hypothetical protein
MTGYLDETCKTWTHALRRDPWPPKRTAVPGEPVETSVWPVRGPGRSPVWRGAVTLIARVAIDELCSAFGERPSGRLP